MSVNPVKRKLAAILAADAVGYSRMMAADEEGTLKILSAHRSVIDGIIQFHEGRIISTAGDSVLAEFASPTQAVRCAVEIQDALKTRNDALPEDRRMHFRIGVNLGDVMVKGDDLLGDGVNVAARLEGIAEPGNIYVSSSVYDQIAGKLDLGFVDLGEKSLKNIDRPIRTYRVERGAGRRAAAGRKPARGAGLWVSAAAAVLVLGAGAWYAAQQSRTRSDDEAKAKAAETELAKARAEAEEARKAAAAASASAEAAKRALEEQRIAETRARAQAELASARADAEATRRKAQAELASAEETRRAAEAAAKARAAEKPAAQAALAPAPAAKPAAVAAPKPPAPAKWVGTWACAAAGSTPPGTFVTPVTSVGNAYELAVGKAGQPGLFQMKGTRQPDGSLQLAGTGISSLPDFRGQTYKAAVSGKFSGERYVGRGTLGTRDCALVLQTEAEAARETAAQSAPWAGTLVCEAIQSDPPGVIPMSVTANGQEFQLSRGTAGQPRSLQMNGRREPDGRMRVAGAGISGMKENLGQGYKATFDGKFASDRYQGRGKLGSRDCSLIIARR